MPQYSYNGFKTIVVNSRIQEYDINIMRPTKYGNPFIIGVDGTREEVIEKYKNHILKNKELYNDAKKELKGKRLGCCCKPSPCHGDILVLIAEDVL
jgi:hypothetical protein